jgi:hypothetical protein
MAKRTTTMTAARRTTARRMRRATDGPLLCSIAAQARMRSAKGEADAGAKLNLRTHRVSVPRRTKKSEIAMQRDFAPKVDVTGIGWRGLQAAASYAPQ